MTTSIYHRSKFNADYTYLDQCRDTFEIKAFIKHDFMYTYPFLEEEYAGSKIPITIRCEDHGDFLMKPNSHISGSGHGCTECGYIKSSKSKTSNTEEFVSKSSIVHNNIYLYPNTVYKSSKKEVKIECAIHGDFPQTPNSHLSGAGCPTCAMMKSKIGYSKVGIRWIESFNNSNIQHAENGGEHRINKPDGSYFLADGYDSITNTVYEFHGDAWHGNPNLFKSNVNCNPFDKEVTAGELYQNTIDRENEIKDLGYNLVVIWESDFI